MKSISGWRTGLAALATGAVAVAATTDRARGTEGEGPICNRPEVLEVVAAGLAARGAMVDMQWGAAGQAPTGQQDLVLCSVRVRLHRYDTDRFGYLPIPVDGVHHYTVRVRQNGLFVGGVDD